MPTEQGLGLFDAAWGRSEPLLVPVQLDAAALRARAGAGALPALLRAVVRGPRGRQVEKGSLVKLLVGVPEGEREAVVLELLRGHVAAVLGHDSAADVDPDLAFKDLGFDSLAAVELRNRLGAATGLSLAPTLVFDYPTAAALAGYLAGEVVPDDERAERDLGEAEVKQVISRLEAMLAPAKSDPRVRERAGARLRSLLVELSDSKQADGEVPGEELGSMSDDEMFELIDEEFGEVSPDGG
jgi:acyl carrier protein